MELTKQGVAPSRMRRAYATFACTYFAASAILVVALRAAPANQGFAPIERVGLSIAWAVLGTAGLVVGRAELFAVRLSSRFSPIRAAYLGPVLLGISGLLLVGAGLLIVLSLGEAPIRETATTGVRFASVVLVPVASFLTSLTRPKDRSRALLLGFSIALFSCFAGFVWIAAATTPWPVVPELLLDCLWGVWLAIAAWAPVPIA
jgi:hypothetical protein